MMSNNSVFVVSRTPELWALVFSFQGGVTAGGKTLRNCCKLYIMGRKDNCANIFDPWFVRYGTTRLHEV